MKKLTLKDLKNAQIPQSRSFKTGLKENLLTQAEKKYSSAPHPNSFMKTLFRLSISFAVIALLVTQVALPGESTSTLQMFIQEANAVNEEHADEIYHATIQMEDSMYFETENFTGWKTTSKVSKDLWLAPNKDLREEITFTSWNGPLEDGSFEEVSSQDTGLSVYDEYGNRLSYTKLEVTGTEIVEKDGELLEEEIYNVHPGKQHETEELLTQYLDQIVCVTTEENQDFTGYAWAKMSETDLDFFEMTARAYPKAELSQIMTELDKALSEGRLASDEALELFEQIQEDSRISYTVNESEDRTLHQISFNQTDFLGGSFSNSKEALQDSAPADVLVTYSFDGETYELVSILAETSYHGNVTQRSSYTVVNSEYLDYESNTSLFKATDEFTLLSLSDAFEQDTSKFEPGCYKQTERLSPEEEEATFERLEELLADEEHANSKALWEGPLLTNFQYYTLPGDPTVHEVK